MSGTPFQESVWAEIRKIPKGSVRTYKDIALSLGKPNAVRAVANACGKNPHPYPGDTPCHRVIRSDGKLGGYSGPGGLSRKREILADEGVNIK